MYTKKASPPDDFMWHESPVESLRATPSVQSLRQSFDALHLLRAFDSRLLGEFVIFPSPSIQLIFEIQGTLPFDALRQDTVRTFYRRCPGLGSLPASAAG